MALLFFNEDSGDIRTISSIHYKPDTLDVATRSKGIEVAEESIPTPETQEGKDYILKYNLVALSFVVSYEDRPLTAEEELQILKTQQSAQINRLEQMESDSMAFQDFVLSTIGGV